MKFPYKSWHVWVPLGVFAALIIVGNLVAIPILRSAKQVDSVVVNDLQVVTRSLGTGATKSKYMVFTDVGPFENSDSLHLLKFDSASIQARLKVGKCYEVVSYGWPILSLFRNIKTVQDLPCK